MWTGSQKPHFARDGVARALGLPQDKVHGIWVPAPAPMGATTPEMPGSMRREVTCHTARATAAA